MKWVFFDMDVVMDFLIKCELFVMEFMKLMEYGN